MVEQRTYDFCVSQTQRLADLVGIRSDLTMVRVLVNAFLAYPSQPESIQTLYRNAFCFTAIVIYGRTFGTGTRENLPRALIERLGPEWVESHDYFKNLRDKWIAHSTNNFEQSRVTIQVELSEAGRVLPTGISDGHTMTVSLSSDDMKRLGRLSDRILSELSGEIDTEKQRVLEFAKTLDLTRLLKDPEAFARPNSILIHDRPRPKF